MQDAMEPAVEFFVLFAKFECAVKHGGFLRQPNGRAAPDWIAFAKDSEITLAGLQEDEKLAEYVNYLVTSPPKEQVVKDGKLDWDEKASPTNFAGLLLAIARVRNNLFHGGKFDCKKFENEGRSVRLITASIVVLRNIIQQLKMDIE